MVRLRKLLRLPPRERRDVLAAALLLLGARLVLTLLPFGIVRTLVSWLGRAGGAGRHRNEAPVEQLARAVRLAADGLPVSTSCLVRALAGEVLLRRRGYPAHLCIGVAHPAGSAWHAHAWLESDGRVVLGAEGAGRFTALQSPPSRSLSADL